MTVKWIITTKEFVGKKMYDLRILVFTCNYKFLSISGPQNVFPINCYHRGLLKFFDDTSRFHVVPKWFAEVVWWQAIFKFFNC